MISTTKVKEEDATKVGTKIWLHGPGDPFWKMFPPCDINKPPDKINRMMHVQRMAWMIGLRSN